MAKAWQQQISLFFKANEYALADVGSVYFVSNGRGAKSGGEASQPQPAMMQSFQRHRGKGGSTLPTSGRDQPAILK